MKSKILALLLIGTMLALLAGDIAGTASAQESPQEFIELRTQNSKTYQLSDGTYQLVAYSGPIHYKDDPDNTLEPWKDINTGITSSPRTNWDWEVTKGLWHLLIKDDTTVALGRDGNWIGFRLDGIAYLDVNTKEYVILQQKQNVTPTVSGNKIRWENIFYGTNLEYTYIENRFRENIEVTQLTRDWLANNPPSSYGLNNQNTYLTFYMECDWKDAYPAEDEDGNPVNWSNTFESEIQTISFRHQVKDYIVAMLPLSRANIRAPPPGEEGIPIRKRFFSENDKNYLLFGSQVTKLNQLPTGTIVFDPDTFYPDEDPEESSFDGKLQHLDDAGQTWAALIAETDATSFDDSGDYLLVRMSCIADSAWYYLERNIITFPTNELPDDALVTAATLTLYGYAKNDIFTTPIAPDSNIYASSPAGTTGLANGDFDSFGTTPFSTAITYANWNVGDPGNPNDFVFNAAGIAAISKTAASEFGWINANYDVAEIDPGTEAGKYARQAAWSSDKGEGYKPKLVVTYIIPPTVVTNSATSVEETTATLSGNITATGGENADFTGVEWGTETGVYTDNQTTGGSFGAGAFNENITGLTKGELYYHRAMAHNSAGWGYGSEVTFLTKPDSPTGLATSSRNNNSISISWTNGTGFDYAEVRYDTAGYPADNTSGTQAYWGNGASTTISTLNPGQVYYIRAWNHATEGGLWTTGDSTADLTDYTNPGDPSNAATSNITTSSFDLDWTKGTGGDYSMVRYKAGSYPTGVGDGSQGYYDTDNTTNIAGLNPNVTYYVRIWARDSDSNYYSDSYSQATATTLVGTPTVTNNGGATNITDTAARLRGELTVTGGENPTAHIYWGDDDASDNAPAWDNDVNLGALPLGTFYTDIATLSANTTYFYRCYTINSGGNDWANSTANFTTLEITPPSLLLLAPTGFTLLALSESHIRASWDAVDNITGYLLLVSTDSYPNDPAGGYAVAYSGNATSVDLAGYNLDFYTFYFSLWSYKNPYSDDYAIAEIGGDELTDELGNLIQLFQNIFQFLPLILFSILAFWRFHAVLFMLTAGASLILGFYWYDSFTTNQGLAISLMLLIYSFVCIGFAFRCIFWREKEIGE